MRGQIRSSASPSKKPSPALIGGAAAGIATRRAQLGSVASDGTVTAIGSGVAQCCAALAGVGERSGGFLYRIGMRLDSGAPALYRLALADGSGELLGDLAPDLLPNALFATDGAPVGPPPPPDIFRDGFEAASPVPAADALAGKSATGSNALRVAQLASGRAGAAGGAGEHLQHSSPSDGAKGLVEARAPVLVPGPRPALLGLLVLLLALGAQASLGRSTRRTR